MSVGCRTQLNAPLMSFVIMKGLSTFLMYVLLCRRSSWAVVRVTISVSFADLFFRQPNCLLLWAPVNSATSAILSARIFSNSLPRHESSKMGWRLLLDPRFVLPGFGIRRHLVIFRLSGNPPCLRRLPKRSASIWGWVLVRLLIILYEIRSGPVAELVLLFRRILAIVVAETA